MHPTKTPYIVLALCTTIALIGVLVSNIGYQKSSQADQVNIIQGDLKKIVQPTAVFYSKIFQARDKTFVSIPYKFEGGEVQPLWLYLSTPAGETTIARLMAHPVLYNLNWDRIADNHVALYQKSKKYNSIQDFLANPPGIAQVAIDQELIKVPPYSSLNATTLTPETNPETMDYILTTYQPSRQEGDVFFYETILDATKALVNDKKELSWTIVAPQATTKTPYYIGSIHVDFRL